ncbi:MAG: macro domain-containing protein [Acidobacteriia bacterium]|nr:macro domain-containing protein [Terriglobia bacterium]
MKVSVLEGDITEQVEVDAIVNAANTDLVLGAGVAGAIRRKGGDVIDRESRAKGPIRLGEAIATTAGNLPNKAVIHAAVMGYRMEDERIPKRPGSLTSGEIIYKATQASLLIATDLKMKSLAFPALGTGVAGFPTDECAEAMVRAVRDFAPSHPQSSVGQVIFVLFDPRSFKIFQEAINRK